MPSHHRPVFEWPSKELNHGKLILIGFSTMHDNRHGYLNLWSMYSPKSGPANAGSAGQVSTGLHHFCTAI